MIFLRHAESEGNILPILQSQTNYDLTKKGENQENLIKKEIAPYKHFFKGIRSSPYERTIRTCEICMDILQERDF